MSSLIFFMLTRGNSYFIRLLNLNYLMKLLVGENGFGPEVG